MNASTTTSVQPARRAAETIFNTYPLQGGQGGPRCDVGAIALLIERETHSADAIEALEAVIVEGRRLGMKAAVLAEAERVLAVLKGQGGHV